MIIKKYLKSIVLILVMITSASLALDKNATNQQDNEIIGSSFGVFLDLDNSNAINSDYINFLWNNWKVAVAFVNPYLTKDSLKANSRIFRNLNPKKEYLSFLKEEISDVWFRNTVFLSVDWYLIPVKNEFDTLEFHNEKYAILLPDSTKGHLKNSGCRFALLFEEFSAKMNLAGYDGISLMYQNASEDANKFKNYANLTMYYSFSYKYVIYDIFENKVVQFGKAHDENKRQMTNFKNIKDCLDDVLMDVIEISKFYKKN